MIGYHAATRMIAAAIFISVMSPLHLYAQTGAAATKQMQDTQRAAHKKARDAKSNTRGHAKNHSENASTPASSAN